MNQDPNIEKDIGLITRQIAEAEDPLTQQDAMLMVAELIARNSAQRQRTTLSRPPGARKRTDGKLPFGPARAIDGTV
jgi:hypothetical protein